MHTLPWVAVGEPVMDRDDENEVEDGNDGKEEMSTLSFFNIPHIK
jgi:hypothetical protein